MRSPRTTTITVLVCSPRRKVTRVELGAKSTSGAAEPLPVLTRTLTGLDGLGAEAYREVEGGEQPGSLKLVNVRDRHADPVVIDDHADALAVADGGTDRLAQGDREGLVGFWNQIADDEDGHGRGGLAGRHRHASATAR